MKKFIIYVLTVIMFLTVILNGFSEKAVLPEPVKIIRIQKECGS